MNKFLPSMRWFDCKSIWLMATITLVSCAPPLMANTGYPTVEKIIDNVHGGSLGQLSPNGDWAVGWGKSDTDAIGYHYPRLYSYETKEIIYLCTDEEARTVPTMMATAVNNYGTIVSGEYGGNAAVWRRSTGKWEILKDKSGNPVAGRADYVSPDGQYVLGGRNRLWDVSGETAVWVDPNSLPADHYIHQEIARGEGTLRFDLEIHGRDGLTYRSEPDWSLERNFSVYQNGYWYDWASVCKQAWGLDWTNDVTMDGFGFTGTVADVSDDGRTIISCDYSESPYWTFMIRLPEPLSEVLPRINLLADYSVSPASGADISRIRTVSILFSREIELSEDNLPVIAYDEDGNEVARALTAIVDPGNARRITASFRNIPLQEGKTYSVKFPAGMVNVKGDKPKINDEITVLYTGRPDIPVAVSAVAPADGSRLSRINLSSNPVIVTFDTNIMLVNSDPGKINLYRLNNDGLREFVSMMNGSIGGNQLMIYPLTEQQLALDDIYEIVISANTFCDLSSSNPNEEFVIRYIGSYVPEVDPSQNVIYFEDFNTGFDQKNIMQYEGDYLQPSGAMAEWTFTAEYPWVPVRDDSEYDFAACAHSMYQTPGIADDWMVTRRLYIPDDTAVLTFQSQNYRANKEDRLKVIIFATDDVYTAITGSIVQDFRLHGDLVYNEIQTPGASEESLAGDWRLNTIPLANYANKNIYIAFLNDNASQSAIFVDNVMVERDLKVAFSNMTPDCLVDKASVPVKFSVNVVSPTEKYSSYNIRLIDNDGKVISSLEESGLNISNGWNKIFSFPQELPLLSGKENFYTIDITMDNTTYEYECSVKNLAFSTEKRVVIEEYTGQTCQFCPEGIVAIDKILADFGDRVIPVAIHSYPGDSFNNAQASNLSSFLGMNAAPSARVDRGDIISPLGFINGIPSFFSEDPSTPSWYDAVAASLANPSVANISANYELSDDNSTVFVKADINYALDKDNVNNNIFAVMVEDDISGIQTNGIGATEGDILGEWGKGGSMSGLSNPYVYDDVFRSAVGSTANGTPGYIPPTVFNGETYTARFEMPVSRYVINRDKTKVVVYLIDAESGKVINACYATDGETGVESINVDSFKTNTRGDKVFVESSQNIEVQLYSINGILLDSAKGDGILSLSGTKGMVILRIATSEGVAFRKIML